MVIFEAGGADWQSGADSAGLTLRRLPPTCTPPCLVRSWPRTTAWLTTPARSSCLTPLNSLPCCHQLHPPCAQLARLRPADMVVLACQVNSDAFGEGWLMKVKMSNPGEVDGLLDPAAYAKQCEE